MVVKNVKIYTIYLNIIRAIFNTNSKWHLDFTKRSAKRLFSFLVSLFRNLRFAEFSALLNSWELQHDTVSERLLCLFDRKDLRFFVDL